MKKPCIKCEEIKNLDQFYKHKRMADGHVNKCIECCKKDVIQNRNSKRDYYIEYDRNRNKTKERRRYRIELQRKRRQKHPNKYRARNYVNNAVRDGRIEKEPCIICGNIESEAHHLTYDIYDNIVWLCRKHHEYIHK